MLKPKILLGILVVLPATVLLMGQTSATKPAAQECKLKPGLPGPAGTHWYYRIDRTANRHCWYLGLAGARILSRARVAESRSISPSPAPQREDSVETTETAPAQPAASSTVPTEAAPAQVPSAQGAPSQVPAEAAPVQAAPVQASPLQAASAAGALPESAVRQQAPTMDFAQRWPDLPKAVDLPSYAEKSVGVSSYANKDAATRMAEQMLPAGPVVGPERAELQQNATSHGAFGSLSLATALAMVSLLLGAGAFKFARRPRVYHGDHGHAGAWQPSWRRNASADSVAATGPASAVGEHDNNSIWRVPIPTDPADDLKTSLRELMGDLERADAARDLHRSFAPEGRQTQTAPRLSEFAKVSRFAVRKLSAFKTIKSPPLQAGKYAEESYRAGAAMPRRVSGKLV